MSILGWIAIFLGAVVIVAGVVGLGRLAKAAEDDSKRCLLEAEKTQRETEALVHRLVYGEGDDYSAPNSRGTRT